MLGNCELGLTYEIVDLTHCNFFKKLQAKLAAVNRTPTLVVDGKKYKGLEDIGRFLKR